MSAETNSLSAENIDRYVKGCGEIALTLNDMVESVLQQGQRPTILIPSRGAVPIYLIAASLLGKLDRDHLLLDPQRTRYFPNRIFEYLSAGRIKQNGPLEPKVDVVLYPFTADVTSEGKEEYLARQLRYSATRAFLDLVSGERRSADLNWYFFLMSKMVAGENTDLSARAIVESLQEITTLDNRQTIIIDTVVSGRAASQILEAFRNLGHKALPLLAQDSIDGITRLQKEYRSSILQSTEEWYKFLPTTPVERAFVSFPLISEDKGAALLGVSAINFANFNREGVFQSVDERFEYGFLPQSCIWSLPPVAKGLREIYLKSFHRFLDCCLDPDLVEGQWPKIHGEIKDLVSQHGRVDIKEVQALAQVDSGARAKESSSHIISVWLTEKQARNWIRDYSQSLANSGLLVTS